jgi:hypothetical protein
MGSVGCWLAAGGLQHVWWLQFCCWMLAAVIMVEINNRYALIRIFSRMTSCSFLALSCCACSLFPSVASGLCALTVSGACLLLFNSYQDKQSPGWTFYGFCCLGVGSMAFPQILFYVPFLWLFMATLLLSLSWRTWAASLLGLLLPYWFALCWLIWTADFSPLLHQLSLLATFELPADYSHLTNAVVLPIALCTVLGLTGTFHFLRQKSNDKIRVRLQHAFFYWMAALTLLFIALQPCHVGCLLPILIVCVSPLAGHYIALTHSRLSNAVFITALTAAILITCYNLWTMS